MTCKTKGAGAFLNEAETNTDVEDLLTVAVSLSSVV